ncbi:MAG TPA: translation elongation factor 4 [Candidatus Saccharimonadales bacterium]|nr:translation elongation factor 4 [Candidatus Saccharimonadales bacterium]
MDQDHLRNFCIIAHIDHGKSTLADRLLELTGTVDQRHMRQQLLDQMDLERERGITIKLQPVRMRYKGYQLNLIDTPGHVDFSYEVSRSLAACEGAILVVDATQGIQAQTLANVYLALAADLTIIPVLNKIDLPAADVERVTAEVVGLLGCDPHDVLQISAKTGQGVEALLEQIVSTVPEPRGQADAPTRALIFDSYYDDYRGVILYVRLVDGSIGQGEQLVMVATRHHALALEVGMLTPEMTSTRQLKTGEIGYIVTNLKSTRQAKVGDTVTCAAEERQSTTALPGYQDVRPFVYAGFFPDSSEHYQELKEAIEKLSLSDSALQFSLENSPVLGFGVRIGFLGLLHMDIVRERLEREYNLSLIVTNPSTDYQVTLTTGDELDIRSAAELPEVSKIREIREPWISGEIIVPKDYVGQVLQLIAGKRGRQKHIGYIDERAVVRFEAPLANLLTDFYDRLKSVTSGYGSFSYELTGYVSADLVRLDFYIAGDMVESLSIMVHRTEVERMARSVVEKLKAVIPRQQFAVALQAAIGGKFIAREDVSAYRKDVTGSLYGGDVSRKKKLLTKQKRGKARMKRFGKIDIPAEAFTVMLKRD